VREFNGKYNEAQNLEYEKCEVVYNGEHTKVPFLSDFYLKNLDHDYTTIYKK
jgi:hypothetical protein